MWSSRLLPGLLACVVLCGALAGCGFEPLHGKNSASSAAALESVRVSVIRDRAGQQLRNRLQQLLSPRGSRADAHWQLKVNLQESIQEILIEESALATRAAIRITAQYSLSQLGTVGGEKAFSRSGESRSVGSYNILDAEFEYVNVVAERDARERALQLLANEIKRRVSIWLREAADAGVESDG